MDGVWTHDLQVGEETRTTITGEEAGEAEVLVIGNRVRVVQENAVDDGQPAEVLLGHQVGGLEERGVRARRGSWT